MTAQAQNVQPFGPTGQEPDIEPFAQADLSQYGNGPALKRGWWFTYDRLYWSVSAPKQRDIGEETLEDPTTALINSVDTSIFAANFTWGNRYEGGYMMDNNQGWLVSYTGLGMQFHDRAFLNPQIVYGDPAGVIAPAVAITYTDMVVHQQTKYDSVELMHVSRWDKGQKVGVFEFMCGARFVSIDDKFSYRVNVDAVDESNLNMDAMNNIVGGQFGVRWYNIRERWTFNVEGRVFGAANFQSVVQNGQFNPPGLLALANTFTSSVHDTIFSPGGELRVETSYEVTKSIALKVGYDITAIGGITRAVERVKYEVPFFGINDGAKHDWVILNGITFGLEFNH